MKVSDVCGLDSIRKKSLQHSLTGLYGDCVSELGGVCHPSVSHPALLPVSSVSVMIFSFTLFLHDGRVKRVAVQTRCSAAGALQ